MMVICVPYPPPKEQGERKIKMRQGQPHRVRVTNYGLAKENYLKIQDFQELYRVRKLINNLNNIKLHPRLNIKIKDWIEPRALEKLNEAINVTKERGIKSWKKHRLNSKIK